MKIYKNASIMPFTGTMDAFTGGLFDSDKAFISDSIIYRGSCPHYCNPVNELNGTYIYGGCLFANFGHFIWESLNRMPVFRKCREYPILFISPNTNIFNTQKLFFKSIGIKNEIILINSPMLVSDLIYFPPQASLQPLSMSDEMQNALAFRNFDKQTDKKIWLSRSRLKYGRIENEPYIEKCALHLGFEIIYPEKLPLLEQIRLIATSRVVAGFSGSQFFSAFFAKKILGKFKIFNRRPRVPATIPFMLDKKKIDGELVMLEVEEAVKGAPEKNMLAREPEKIIQTLASLA